MAHDSPRVSVSPADLALFRDLWPTIRSNRHLAHHLGPQLEGNAETPWDSLGEVLQHRLARAWFDHTAYRPRPRE